MDSEKKEILKKYCYDGSRHFSIKDASTNETSLCRDKAEALAQMQKNDASTFDHELGRDRPTALFGATVQFHHEYSREYGGKWSGGGHIDGVTVRNVSVTSNGRKPRVSMLALNAAHRPENVVFENLTVDGKTVTGPADVELAVGKNAVPPRFETKPSPLSP